MNHIKGMLVSLTNANFELLCRCSVVFVVCMLSCVCFLFSFALFFHFNIKKTNANSTTKLTFICDMCFCVCVSQHFTHQCAYSFVRSSFPLTHNCFATLLLCHTFHIFVLYKLWSLFRFVWIFHENEAWLDFHLCVCMCFSMCKKMNVSILSLRFAIFSLIHFDFFFVCE